jgi:hypothetical protein
MVTVSRKGLRYLMAIYSSAIPEVLQIAYNARKEIVPCFLAAPGIGKTEMIYQFAKDKGVNVVEIIASQILPNEVSGITMPNDKDESMKVYDHARLSSLKDGDILFFDELLQASPQTLSACLTLIQERRMMSGRMLPDVMIVAAANPVPITQIPAPIRQRFMFVDIEWDRFAWIEYVVNKYNITKDIADRLSGIIQGQLDDLRLNRAYKEWNLFTPRTACKLLDLYQANGDKNIVLRFIGEVMNPDIERVYDLIGSQKVKPETQIQEIIDKYSETLPDKEITPQELFKKIQECEDEEPWASIRKELENVSIEG